MNFKYLLYLLFLSCLLVSCHPSCEWVRQYISKFNNTTSEQVTVSFKYSKSFTEEIFDTTVTIAPKTETTIIMDYDRVNSTGGGCDDDQRSTLEEFSEETLNTYTICKDGDTRYHIYYKNESCPEELIELPEGGAPNKTETETETDSEENTETSTETSTEETTEMETSTEVTTDTETQTETDIE